VGHGARLRASSGSSFRRSGLSGQNSRRGRQGESEEAHAGQGVTQQEQRRDVAAGLVFDDADQAGEADRFAYTARTPKRPEGRAPEAVSICRPRPAFSQIWF
jgi:hypothetical protein